MDNVYVRVSHDGRLSRDPRPSNVELHDAHFVVIKQGDDLVIWKDLYGVAGTVVTKEYADTRAFDYVDVSQGRKTSRSIFKFG